MFSQLFNQTFLQTSQTLLLLRQWRKGLNVSHKQVFTKRQAQDVQVLTSITERTGQSHKHWQKIIKNQGSLFSGCDDPDAAWTLILFQRKHVKSFRTFPLLQVLWVNQHNTVCWEEQKQATVKCPRLMNTQWSSPGSGEPHQQAPPGPHGPQSLSFPGRLWA